MNGKTCGTCANYDGRACKIDGFIMGSYEATCEYYCTKRAGHRAMTTEYVLDAEKIAHWRIDNHVPLKQLARAAGVNLSSLSHAIRDGREVKMNLLLNLAEAMGEDPRDIVMKKVER